MILKNKKLGHQQGAALIVSLLLLLVLTIIGVNSMQATSLEEKMAHATLDRNIALQSAESAARAAEALINGFPSLNAGLPGINGLYRQFHNEPDFTIPTTWSNPANHAIAITPDGSANSLYFIQEIGQIQSANNSTVLNIGSNSIAAPSNVTTFRIIARGSGGALTGAEAIIRSHFGRIL